MQRLAVFSLVLLFAATALAGSDDPIQRAQWAAGDALCDVLSACNTLGFSNGVGYNHRCELYAGGGMLYYTNFYDNWIHQVDPATCLEHPLYQAPGGGAPSDLAVIDDEQAGPRAILASNDFAPGHCYLQDLLTGELILEFPTPYGNEGLAYDMQRNRLWIGVFDTGMIEAYDLEGNYLESIPSPEGDGADGLAWRDDKLYALTYSGNLYEYDFGTSTWTLLCYTGGVNGLADDGNYIWGDDDDPYRLDQLDRLCPVEVKMNGPATAERGQPYTFTVTLTNSGSTPVTADVWTELYMPDGNPWPGNPHKYHDNLTVQPEQTIQVNVTQIVPPGVIPGHFWYQINVGDRVPRDADNFDGLYIDILP